MVPANWFSDVVISDAGDVVTATIDRIKRLIGNIRRAPSRIEALC